MKIPLFIEFKNRKVLVLGAGSTGTRRAIKFLNAGAYVKVISKEFTSELQEIAKQSNRIELIKLDVKENFQKIIDYIKWADLIIIAIPDVEICSKIRQACREMSKFFNDSTNAKETEVIVPMEASIYGLKIAITSEGKSSVATRKILSKLIEYLKSSEEIRNYLETWYKVKEYLRQKVPDYKTRMKIYSILDKDLVFENYAKKGEISKAIEYADNIIKKFLELSREK